MIIEGSVSKGLTFKHADGTPYGGEEVSPKTVAAMTDAFSALRNLGFTHKESDGALNEIRSSHVGPPTDFNAILTKALAILRPGAHRLS